MKVTDSKLDPVFVRTVAEIGIHQHDAESIVRRLDEIEKHQRQRDTAGRR